MSQPVEHLLPVDTDFDTSETAWKRELADATTSVPRLLERLALTHHIDSVDIDPEFKCLATDSYIDKIKPGDIHDPLLKQILPMAAESHSPLQLSGVTDPVGDVDAIAGPGLLHKYHGRALLISTGACAIHCRYCFRRHYPYQHSSFSNKTLTNVLSYLSSHPDIEEIILSGGDPLMLDNNKLSDLIKNLETVEHLNTLRIHTRLPVILPSRINAGLITLLKHSRFKVVIVVHANHADEIGPVESDRFKRLQQAGITLLNQSVLLRGINDRADHLISLSKRLFGCSVIPYYLHLLDPVKGAMHFDVPRETATKLISEMELNLPGYLVPKLVQEIAGNKSKTAIFRN